MGQSRVDKEGIAVRQAKIEAWENQISVWKTMAEKSPALEKMREASEIAVKQTKDEILQRVKTLSFATDPDRLDLAKLAGRLDGFESVYYDIAEAPKKIEQARKIIAVLVEEIKRAKKGELIETRA